MRRYAKGDHVKIEVEDMSSGQSEWMWMLVENCDDEARVAFGRLDNEPIINTDLRLGEQLAISFDKVREHRKF
jgi:uncharacterized protein YegJ (DUF2314 family)